MTAINSLLQMLHDALHECCQYERVAKIATSKLKMESVTRKIIPITLIIQVLSNNNTHLKVVFDTYFALKDALVKTDGNGLLQKQKEMKTALSAVKMETLGCAYGLDEGNEWFNDFCRSYCCNARH
jgi:hypothetical protein